MLTRASCAVAVQGNVVTIKVIGLRFILSEPRFAAGGARLGAAGGLELSLIRAGSYRSR